MTDSVADDQIKAFFERWQRLEEEKDAISGDLRELFAEMKANGFDTKVARAVFRDKTKDQNARNEFEAIYDLYWSALGTPRATGARPARATTNQLISSPVYDSGQEEADGAFQAETQHSVPSAHSTTEHHINAVVYALRVPALYTDNTEPVSVPSADADDRDAPLTSSSTAGVSVVTSHSNQPGAA